MKPKDVDILQISNEVETTTNVYFMSYHTATVDSYDFYTSLKEARKLGDEVHKMISQYDESAKFFPYRYYNKAFFIQSMQLFDYLNKFCWLFCSVFYVFYEQYLTIWEDAIFSLGISLATIFAVSFLLTGLDIIAALIILFMVTLILINMGGTMYLWNISLNAISLVNLVVVSMKKACLINKKFFFIKKKRIQYASFIVYFSALELV